MNCDFTLHSPTPQDTIFEGSANSPTFTNSASAERAVKRYEIAMEKFGHLMPESTEHDLCPRAREAEIALKKEEDFASCMYFSMRNAHKKVYRAMHLAGTDSDAYKAIQEAETILRNVLRLYLDVHSK